MWTTPTAAVNTMAQQSSLRNAGSDGSSGSTWLPQPEFTLGLPAAAAQVRLTLSFCLAQQRQVLVGRRGCAS